MTKKILTDKQNSFLIIRMKPRLLTKNELAELNSLETVAVLHNGVYFKLDGKLDGKVVHALWQKPHGKGWVTLGEFDSVRDALKNIFHRDVLEIKQSVQKKLGLK